MEITEVSWHKPSTKEKREAEIHGIDQLSISHLHRNNLIEGYWMLPIYPNDSRLKKSGILLERR